MMEKDSTAPEIPKKKKETSGEPGSKHRVLTKRKKAKMVTEHDKWEGRGLGGKAPLTSQEECKKIEKKSGKSDSPVKT